jgi:hypothetical protein
MQNKKEFTPHTCVQGTTHSNDLGELEPISKLRPRILFIIDEIMGRYWHHMAYHAKAMPHSNKVLHTKMIVMSSFVSYHSSLMMLIKS